MQQAYLGNFWKIKKEQIGNMKVDNLFSGRTNGDVNLNGSVNDYNFIEIVFSGNSNYLQSNSVTLDVRYIMSSNIQLSAFEINRSTNNIVVRSGDYSVSNTKLTLIDYTYGSLGGTLSKTAPYIYILSVNGYKF